MIQEPLGEVAGGKGRSKVDPGPEPFLSITIEVLLQEPEFFHNPDLHLAHLLGPQASIL